MSIIPNGRVQFLRATPGAVDAASGFSLKPSVERVGEPLPCQIVPTRRDNLALSLGEHVTAATYQILLDEGCDTTPYLRVDSDGQDLHREFHVKWQEPLRAVRQIRLWV